MASRKQWYVEEQERQTSLSITQEFSVPSPTGERAEAQIRTIAWEANVETDFVRRTQDSPEAIKPLQVAHPEFDYMRLAIHIPKTRQLSRQRKRAAILLPVGYAFLLGTLFTLVPGTTLALFPKFDLIIALVIWIPLTLSFVFGATLHSKRLGLRAGAMLGGLAWLVLSATMILNDHEPWSINDLSSTLDFVVGLGTLRVITGAGMGLMGAVARQSLPPLSARLARMVSRREKRKQS